MRCNNIMTAYASAFVDELARVGVHDVVISPGSRSTPLAMLMAEHPQIKVWIQIDERSAGFFALGMAKATSHPVALLCTSGTAAANYLPAVVEAHYSRNPLLIITADRPHELRDVGAPQAIDQIELFGKYVKWFVDLALPEDTKTMLNYIRTVAGRAVATVLSGPWGVVHLNFPFREPLIPNLSLPDLWEGGRSEGRCYVRVLEGKKQLERIHVQRLSDEIKGWEKGLIVCGPDEHSQYVGEVAKLAEILQYPILADPLSQMRSGPHSKEWVIDSYDGFLRSDEIKNQLQPEVVIRFGAMPTSKAFLLYLQACPVVRYIVVDGEGGWREPTLMASDIIHADPVEFCRLLSDCTEKRVDSTRWGKQWKELHKISRNYLQTEGQMDDLFEGQVIMELQKLLPDQATLFVGNSMPIRDLDTFFTVTDKNIHIIANRGANGIDGVISSALGASVYRKPLVLLLGDLSFFHDLNGLLMAKLHKLDITIVVINNDGGGIFSFLPQEKQEDHFEMLFGTPLGLDFEHVVKMYGGSFSRITNWGELKKKVTDCLFHPGLSVIEIPTQRRENAILHKQIWQSLSGIIDEWI